MTQFRDLHDRINEAIRTTTKTFFEEREIAAVAQFNVARKNRAKAFNPRKHVNNSWNETYVVQVERNHTSAQIRVEGIPDIWKVEPYRYDDKKYCLSYPNKDKHEYLVDIESAIQKAIMYALSSAYCGVL